MKLCLSVVTPVDSACLMESVVDKDKVCVCVYVRASEALRASMIELVYTEWIYFHLRRFSDCVKRLFSGALPVCGVWW